jgi:hypothetical protein
MRVPPFAGERVEVADLEGVEGGGGAMGTVSANGA